MTFSEEPETSLEEDNSFFPPIDNGIVLADKQGRRLELNFKKEEKVNFLPIFFECLLTKSLPI